MSIRFRLLCTRNESSPIRGWLVPRTVLAEGWRGDIPVPAHSFSWPMVARCEASEQQEDAVCH